MVRPDEDGTFRCEMACRNGDRVASVRRRFPAARSLNSENANEAIPHRAISWSTAFTLVGGKLAKK